MPTSGLMRKALWWSSAALSLFVASCGVSTEFFRDVDRDLLRGEYLSAVSTVRENASLYGDKATVLYHLDLGLLYHYAARPDSSIVHLLAAEREMEDLYTESVSLAALSVLLNDNVVPYDGEDFEKVLVNMFLSLDFAALGQPDEALVEVRKADLKFRQLARQYEGKNRYQDDALIRYLGGALFEANGEFNDAFISYRKAYETYQEYEKAYGLRAPAFLLDDLVRTATLISFDDEARHYRELGGQPFAPSSSGKGTILVITYAGRGPTKMEVRPKVSIPDSAGTIHTFQMALPEFVTRFKGSRTYSVEARNVRDTSITHTAESFLAEDVNAIAAQTLEDRLAKIYLKSGGRALLKFLAAEKAKSELKKRGDALTNLFGSIAVDLLVGATEHADLRCWQTLPAQIHLARLAVPPGDYVVRTRSADGFTQEPAHTLRVRSGRMVFTIVHDMR